ncbi:MAG: hypothetical protein WDW36_000857 [Sanguina aurantia]
MQEILHSTNPDDLRQYRERCEATRISIGHRPASLATTSSLGAPLVAKPRRSRKKDRDDGGVPGWWKRYISSQRKRSAGRSWLDYFAIFLPFLRWVRTYKVREYLPNDIIAGLSVAFMAVPQSLSYANTAGLPAVFGLYGCFTPCLAYAILGTSRQLAVGPVAVTSLLIASKLKQIVPGSSSITNPNSPDPDQVSIQDDYNHKAIQLAFLVSVMYTIIGVLRLGFLTNFLSHSVIGGFTSGAAIIIGLSQFKYIYIANAHDFQWQEFIMGMSLLIWLFTFREAGKRFPRTLGWTRPLGPLTACIIGLVSVACGVGGKGIRTIGNIPAGLPPITVSWWFPGGQMDNFSQLFTTALVVMAVDLLESTSIARALAMKNRYELSPNLEIRGLGLANLVGAATNCYTTTGSFSRSSVNNEAGAKSPLAQFISAWVVAAVLLFLTPLFKHLPYNVLGAIVVVAVSNLFEYEQAIYLFKRHRLDFVCWLASFLGVTLISVEIGLAIALGVAVSIFFFKNAFPSTSVLGQVPDTLAFRCVRLPVRACPRRRSGGHGGQRPGFWCRHEERCILTAPPSWDPVSMHTLPASPERQQPRVRARASGAPSHRTGACAGSGRACDRQASGRLSLLARTPCVSRQPRVEGDLDEDSEDDEEDGMGEAIPVPGVMIFAINAPMYFANVQRIRDNLYKHKAKAASSSAEAGARFEYVILELSAVSHMDSSASSAVLTWIHELSHDGIQLLLAGPNASCMLTLEHANVPMVLGPEWIFPTLYEAVSFVKATQLQQAELASAALRTAAKMEDIYDGPSPLHARPQPGGGNTTSGPGNGSSARGSSVTPSTAMRFSVASRGPGNLHGGAVAGNYDVASGAGSRAASRGGGMRPPAGAAARSSSQRTAFASEDDEAPGTVSAADVARLERGSLPTSRGAVAGLNNSQDFA